MKKLAAALIAFIGALAPTAALAYVGPGAGLSLLGALWAFIAAVATALIFVIAWPVRRLLRQRRAARRPEGDAHANAASQTPTDEKSR